MAQRNRPVAGRIGGRASRRGDGRIRIIGGKWKGRKLDVPDRPGLRPTMDRVRETLFSWLGPDIVDRRVLDLFAGTGALSFEALSRGAASATLVEQDRAAAGVLRAAATRLGGHCRGNCRIHVASAPRWVRRQREWPWDLVFVDPPFGTRLGAETLALLRGRNVLVYFEEGDAGTHGAPDSDTDLPGWETLRESRAGACRFRLLRPAGSATDWLRLRGAATIAPQRV